MGLSKHVKRIELLNAKKCGVAKEYSDWVQRNIFDRGHKVEGQMREVVEAVIGEELFPITASEGELSASCDGLTLDLRIAFEHKQLNDQLFESVKNNILPDEYLPQVQQILLVTGADYLIFVCSDGTKEKMASMNVYPDLCYFQRIILAKEIFYKDLEKHEYTSFERVVADTIDSLPVASIQAKGEIVASNLGDITHRFDLFLSSQKTELITDDDFANGEAVAKFSRETAKNLQITAKQTVDQISSISEAVRTLENYADKFNGLGLMLEKLVKSEKDARKNAMVLIAKDKLNTHISNLNQSLRVPIDFTSPDFVTAMKNKRTIESLQNAVDGALIIAIVDADLVAKKYSENIATLDSESQGYEFLFEHDTKNIIKKDAEDLKNLIKNRIADYQKSQKKIVQEPAKISEKKGADLGQNSSVDFTSKTQNNARPSDFEIIKAVASHFKVGFDDVEAWIKEMKIF